MEGNTATTSTVSTESFSYRWLLVNLKPTLDHQTSSDHHDHSSSSSDIEAAAFIVMDPNNTPSKRFSFVPTPPSIIPTKNIEKSIDNGIEASSPVISKPDIVISIHQIHSIFAKKCWKSSKKILRKCLIGLFSNTSKTTICESTCSSTSSSPKPLVDRRRRRSSQKLDRSLSSPSTLTTTSIAPEGSIYEAVLHCKRSIEK